jgi:hypothetical protein
MSNNKTITFTQDQKEALLEAQFNRAMSGDSALLIHLGETVLNQIKTNKLLVEPVPMSELSLDDLYGMIEDRLVEDKIIDAPVQIISESVSVPALTIAHQKQKKSVSSKSANKIKKQSKSKSKVKALSINNSNNQNQNDQSKSNSQLDLQKQAEKSL